MKIISGKMRGRNFFMPHGLRPTTNMTRKAIFDIIGHDLEGWAVLDLFAGSGSVGLEALSLGARKVTFVEGDPKYYAVLEENTTLLGFKSPGSFSDQVELMNADAFAAVKNLSRQGRKFDLIFLDPPYNRDLLKKILKTLEAYDILNPNSFLVVEHSKDEKLPDLEGRFVLGTHRKYGISNLAVYQTVS